jgi:hypothetical protein
MLDYSCDLQGKDSDVRVIWWFEDYTDHGLTVDLRGYSSRCSLRPHRGTASHSLFPAIPNKQLLLNIAGQKQFPKSGTEGSNQ